MNVLALTLAICNACLVVVGLRSCSKFYADASALFFYALGLFLVVRPATIAFGLHHLWPAEFFTDQVLAHNVLIDAQFLVSGWIIASIVGISLTKRSALKAWEPGGSSGFDDQQLLVGSVGLTVIAAAVTVPLWVRFGGPSGLTQAFKIDKEVGQALLRIIPLTATVFTAASVLSRMRLDRDRARRRTGLLMRFAVFVFAAYLSYSWGARDAPVFGALAIVVGRVTFSRSILTRSAQLALAFTVVMSLVVGLRIARDLSIQDEVNSAITNENLVGQISVAANLTNFDALALIVRDGPPGGDFHLGSDFLTATQVALPILETSSAETRNIALQVAQKYNPDRRNGWPSAALGDWFVNFGWYGSIFGGLASGVLVGVLTKKFARLASDPLVFAITIFVMGTFLRGGFWVRSINLGLQFSIAMGICVTAAKLIPRRQQSNIQAEDLRVPV